jgi:hypothetical protein
MPAATRVRNTQRTNSTLQQAQPELGVFEWLDSGIKSAGVMKDVPRDQNTAINEISIYKPLSNTAPFGILT